MEAADMILISVGDHVRGPADMLDAHVRAVYKDRAPRVETDRNSHQPSTVAGNPSKLGHPDGPRYSAASNPSASCSA